MANESGSAAPPLTPETRIAWTTDEEVPFGWTRGNQCFVGEHMEVFFYDPKVHPEDRKDDGSTDRWIKFRKVTKRRYVTDWEVVDD